MKKILSIFLILILVGCGSTSVKFYDGPELPQNKTATISLWTDTRTIDEKYRLSELKISLVSINDKKVVINDSVSILPGDYSVDIKCQMNMFESIKTFSIQAEAGKNYAIIAIGKSDECNFKKLSLLSNGRFIEL